MKQIIRILLSLFLISVFIASASIPALSAPPYDVDDIYTISLLHFNGPESYNFADESGKTWISNGDAFIDNAQYKFGSFSGRFDGVGDYINSADTNDWQLDGGSNSNEWTIDFWTRWNADPGTGIQGFASQRADGNNHWFLTLNNNELRFVVRSGGSIIIDIANAWNPAAGVWYHVAVVKQGITGYKFFINGSQIGSTQTDTSTIPNFAADINIGRYVDSTGTERAFNGWIDELRISKIARWTSNFTPASSEYMPATPTPSNTATDTATFTATFTATDTPTATNTYTPTATDTPTETPTITNTVPGPTNTYTDTPTATNTYTPTPTGPTSTSAMPTWYISPEITYDDIMLNVVLLGICGVLIIFGASLIILLVTRRKRGVK